MVNKASKEKQHIFFPAFRAEKLKTD